MSEFEFFRPCADAMINLIVKKSVSEKNVSDKKCVNRMRYRLPRAACLAGAGTGGMQAACATERAPAWRPRQVKSTD